MHTLLTLYFQYKTKQSRNDLIKEALKQRKWILNNRDSAKIEQIYEIDAIITKLLKTNLL